MSLKKHKEIIVETLNEFFQRNDNISFFFLKKQKDKLENEVIIPFKSHKQITEESIAELELLLRKKTNEDKLKLMRWSHIVGKIVPESQVFKIPFFDSRDIEEKSHSWRLCPIGEHWVRRHEKHLVSGKITDHDGHCRKNKKNKSEYYSASELRLISEFYFKDLENDLEAMPVSGALSEFTNEKIYDFLIAGWTKFWNEVFKPKEVLSTNLVKALIATESSFSIPKEQKSHDGTARGPIQITENTRKILQDLTGELKNHHINLNVEESTDPVTNIGAGIRWLFHKKYLLERKLKREVSWMEAIYEYKGITRQIGKNKDADRIVRHLNEFFERQQKGKLKK